MARGPGTPRERLGPAERIGDPTTRCDPWVPRAGGRPDSGGPPAIAALDVVLGGPVSRSIGDGAGGPPRAGRAGERSPWIVARRSPIGLALNAKASTAGGDHAAAQGAPEADLDRGPSHDPLTFDDPRHDPMALAWAKASSMRGPGPTATRGSSATPGTPAGSAGRAGSALAAVERGEAALTPALAASARDLPAPLVFVPAAGSPAWVEGAAIVPGGRHRDVARCSSGSSPSGPGRAASDRTGGRPGRRRPARRPARRDAGRCPGRALDRLARRSSAPGIPHGPRDWMTQAPPWPPASIEAILGRQDAMPPAGDADGRDRPRGRRPRLALAELARPEAAGRRRLAGRAGRARRDGRLAREPRFRAWLRAEWTAWARQRYRRVARLAEKAAGPLMIRVILEGLVKRYDRVAVVDGASLEIRPGELTYVLGPSGAGKTTLARLRRRARTARRRRDLLRRPDGPQRWPRQERRVGMVFQDDALWPRLTVAENIGYGLQAPGSRLAAERRDRVAEALEPCGSTAWPTRSRRTLTALQRQRVALARALAVRPELLILDEPLGRLEPRVRDEFRDEIRRIHAETEITTLVLTRDAREALALADRLAVMDLGRIVQVGPPARGLQPPGRHLRGPAPRPDQPDPGAGRGDRLARRVVVRTPFGRMIGQSAAGPACRAGRR